MSDVVFPDPRLLQLLEQQRSGMPPWEAFQWFDTPVERVVTLTGAPVWDQIAGHDVRRVALWLGLGSNVGVNFSTRSDILGGGFILGTSGPPLVIRQQTDGVLCQVAWYAQASAGARVDVIEVLLRAWPGGDPVG